MYHIRSWAPMKRPTRSSRTWWTSELTEMRKIYTSAAWRVRRVGIGVEEGDTIRKEYKKALLLEKKKY